MPLGHLGLNVPDLARARSYYGELLPLLDYELFLDDEDQFAFMPAGGKRGTFVFFYPSAEPGDYSRERTGLQHLAFMVPTRSRVRAVHQQVVTSGGAVVHEPQWFPQ